MEEIYLQRMKVIDGVPVIGLYKNKLVAAGPKPPGNYTATRGECCTKNVIIGDKPQVRSCILADEGLVIELDDLKLSDAIFGEVRQGYILQQASEGAKFRRKERVAIKTISVREANQNLHQEDPIKELFILQMLKTQCSLPHVSCQLSCVREKNRIFSIMPYYGEELFHYAGKLSQKAVVKCFNQIVKGVIGLHSVGVCHRDLSLENILFNKETEECTIIDFGMSIIVPRANKAETEEAFHCSTLSLEGSEMQAFAAAESLPAESMLLVPQKLCGKENYVAPEVIAGSQPFDPFKADVWALGIILFILFTGRPPFVRAAFGDKWFAQIQSDCLKANLKRWNINQIPDSALKFLERMLKSTSPDDRMSAEDIISHQFLCDA